jgi:hypothetical protein
MLDQFYIQHSEPNASCFLALRDIILRYDEAISETKKYGMPCFVYKNKALCYLWSDKKTNEPYILLVDGNLLDHPALESGDRKRMKILRINPNTDIDILTVTEVVSASISLRK